jgi:molybdenum cofactor cytidylyltransferase
MGSPKPLLPFGESTFLEHLLKEFAVSRSSPILVVLGHEQERVRREVAFDKAIPVVNSEYKKGMLSSIRAGLKALQEHQVEGVLICPVDHPKVDRKVIDTLIERFEDARPPVVLPICDGRRGHPVLFSQAVFEELLDAPDSVGARQVVWDHSTELLEVEVDDSGIHCDVDTPGDYRTLTSKEA